MLNSGGVLSLVLFWGLFTMETAPGMLLSVLKLWEWGFGWNALGAVGDEYLCLTSSEEYIPSSELIRLIAWGFHSFYGMFVKVSAYCYGAFMCYLALFILLEVLFLAILIFVWLYIFFEFWQYCGKTYIICNMLWFLGHRISSDNSALWWPKCTMHWYL